MLYVSVTGKLSLKDKEQNYTKNIANELRERQKNKEIYLPNRIAGRQKRLKPILLAILLPSSVQIALRCICCETLI